MAPSIKRSLLECATLCKRKSECDLFLYKSDGYCQPSSVSAFQPTPGSTVQVFKRVNNNIQAPTGNCNFKLSVFLWMGWVCLASLVRWLPCFIGRTWNIFGTGTLFSLTTLINQEKAGLFWSSSNWFDTNIELILAYFAQNALAFNCHQIKKGLSGTPTKFFMPFQSWDWENHSDQAGFEPTTRSECSKLSKVLNFTNT